MLAQWRLVIAAIFSLTVLPVLTLSAQTAGDRIVAADFKGDSIELISVLQVVNSNNSKVAIDVPSDTTGQKVRMNLQAISPATPHRWAVFTLTNPDLVGHNFVLQIPRQGFIKSGLIWPRPNATRIISVSASTGIKPVLINSRTAQNYALSIEPGRTVSFAIELSPLELQQALLWHRDAYEVQAGQQAFFNGVVLGIAFLLGVAILSLFAVRQMAVFPAASLFAWSLIGFLLLNDGFLSLVTSQAVEMVWGPTIRGIVEAMMLVGLSVTALAFLQLPKNAPLAAIIFWLATASGIGLAGFSFIDPLMASGLARIGFAIAAVLALFTALMLWNRNIGRAGSSMLVWIVVVMWMVLAAVGCLGLYQSEFIESAIAAGVGLILITMSFTLVQLVFGQSIAASHFLEDSGRRALALAGSEQSVWDWQVAHQVLYVGPELERGLGLDPGLMGSINPRKWLELIHPGDRSAYAGAVDAAEKRGKGAFSQEFRLRRADGAYRWYLLRARAIAGEDGFASRLIGTLTDVTAVKRSQDRLLADAVRDRVTGLPNRALFIDRLERAMRRAAARGMDELFVLVIDLDRFKNVNDGLGHEVGDSLLNVTGSRLARMIGPDDTLARLAGDQFGIIFNGETPSREIIAVADNIRQIVAVPINVRPREIFLTASIGVAQFEPGRDDPEELVKNAEIALYEAKRHGKDQIEFFRSDMLDDRSQLVALESDLRRALDRNEIEVVYQPLKRLVDDQLAGFEALVRWRHHELGLLSPDAFMDMAEETGIIREVGRYVLNEATRQLGIWQRAFRPSDPLFVAVNVSRAQLLNYELISDLRALLRREDIVPGTLKLEVTETLVMQNPELASRVLERACDLGVGIACDDFGTGYSALANLARLPFDTLKIDRAFLLEDGTSENATIIFDAITHLAHNLNLNVVAEGVESEEQLERLRRRGVDYAQGFYIGEPVPAKQVIEALGGQPYAPETADSGLSQLWARLLGRQTPADETAADDLPSPEQQAAEVAEMQAQEEILEPWSPDSNDVSDPGIADWPQETQPEPEQYEQPIEEVEADLDQGDVVLPYPPVHEEIIEPETLETQGSTLEPELPQVGTAPLAPRHQPPEPQSELQPEPKPESDSPQQPVEPPETETAKTAANQPKKTRHRSLRKAANQQRRRRTTKRRRRSAKKKT